MADDPWAEFRAAAAPAADDPWKAFRSVSTAEDMARSGGSGALRGFAGFLGIGGDISKGLGAGTQAMKAAGVPVEQARASMLEAMPEWLRKYHQPSKSLSDVVTGGAGTERPVIGSAEIRKGMESAAGAPVTSYVPQTTPGKYAGTVGEFAGNPLSYAAPGTIPAKILGTVAAGVGSEAAGQATAGTKFEPYARVAGALGGSVVPSTVARVVTPAPASAARQRLVDILNDEGVTSLTAGQRTGNEALRYAESTLGNAPFTGQPANRMVREGQEQFTDAALRRAGTGGMATPDVLAANQKRLGDVFQDIPARNALVPDNKFINDIVSATARYKKVPDSQQKAIVQGYIDDIIPHVNAGAMPGAEYQIMRSMLSREAKANADPYLSDALRGIRNALDSAFGRSISPADKDAWNTALREYGAQKVIEKTASKAGEATAEGVVVPANLRNTVSAENRGAYARGEGPFSELSRAGAGVMGPMPNSGTAQRSMAYKIGDLLTGGIGPALTGRALMSGPVQRYLSNQAAAGAVPHAAPRPVSAAIAALMAQQPGGQ